ncbi:MAG TPA: serine O-acetyltransferase [Mycobacterium sp.]|nr:MAG: serine O-acetyltransferase [Mycobacterium sp.]HOB47988.1 serine O-acetyltransferase [Mycobacterium sp.]HPZ93416.1 serine O-acetyltransferase [Mycobacterium sp.]HQE13862.1 serine O-acetyltransferase [Mycobacterium sp.]
MFAAIRGDLRAVRERDPAARSALEVALCYPGVHAIWGYRVTHWLWQRNAKLAARFLAEVIRKLTGVEIHPGAVIGSRVFIDHATGVVIGETAEVGDDVTIYHGVTLGGTSLDPVKRHPTVGNKVVIGAGAKVLGNIVIGHGSQIGANSVVIKPVPPGSVVVGVPGQIVGPDGSATGAPRTQSDLPDPLGVSLYSLLTRVARLESREREPNADKVIRPPEAGVWHGEDFSI